MEFSHQSFYYLPLCFSMWHMPKHLLWNRSLVYVWMFAKYSLKNAAGTTRLTNNWAFCVIFASVDSNLWRETDVDIKHKWMWAHKHKVCTLACCRSIWTTPKCYARAGCVFNYTKAKLIILYSSVWWHSDLTHGWCCFCYRWWWWLWWQCWFFLWQLHWSSPSGWITLHDW